jgi:hypothetical protein
MLACLGAALINGAQHSIEKDTSISGPAQNYALVFGLLRVIAKKLLRFHPEEARQPLNISLIYLSGRDTAAIGARCAVYPVLCFLRNCLETPLDKIVPFQPGTETQILIALLFPHALDLHQVGHHASSIATNRSETACSRGAALIIEV